MSVIKRDPLSPLVGTLSARELRALRERLSNAPAASPQELGALIDGHERFLAVEARRNEFLDLLLARRLNEGFRALVRATAGASQEDRSVVHAAVAYLIASDDADHDLTSPIGLEDDARVFNAVAAAVGHPDLHIALPE
jgi:hypothetical protein